MSYAHSFPSLDAEMKAMFSRIYQTEEDIMQMEFTQVKAQIASLKKSTESQDKKIDEWTAKIDEKRKQIIDMNKKGTTKAILYSRLRAIRTYEKLLDRMLGYSQRLLVLELTLRSIWMDKISIEEIKKCAATIDKIRPGKIIIDVDKLSDKSSEINDMFGEITGAMSQLTKEMTTESSREEFEVDEDYEKMLEDIVGTQKENISARKEENVIKTETVKNLLETKIATDPLISNEEKSGSDIRISDAVTN